MQYTDSEIISLAVEGLFPLLVLLGLLISLTTYAMVVKIKALLKRK